MARQGGYVVAARAQRREHDLHHREPVIQVLAERPLVHAASQRAIGRGDDAHVDRPLGVAPHAADGARLDGAQKLGLDAQR